jgi:uncharacterized damage-inducible protein DinB
MAHPPDGEVTRMDRRGLQDLLDYTTWAWERTARALDGVPPADYARALPGSGWPSLSACVAHALAGYDTWLNAPWAFALAAETNPGEAALRSWEAAKGFQRACRESGRRALALPDSRLFEERELVFQGRTLPPRSVADVLADCLVHEVSHYGDLNTLFYQIGVKGYFREYSLYLTEPEAFYLDES